jgi:hypothetical protein
MASPFALPSDPPPVCWHFDKAVQALVLVEFSHRDGQPQMNINAWARLVWESARFTIDGLRTMPAAPAAIHEALIRNAVWR